MLEQNTSGDKLFRPCNVSARTWLCSLIPGCCGLIIKPEMEVRHIIFTQLFSCRGFSLNFTRLFHDTSILAWIGFVGSTFCNRNFVISVYDVVIRSEYNWLFSFYLTTGKVDVRYTVLENMQRKYFLHCDTRYFDSTSVRHSTGDLSMVRVL